MNHDTVVYYALVLTTLSMVYFVILFSFRNPKEIPKQLNSDFYLAITTPPTLSKSTIESFNVGWGNKLSDSPIEYMLYANNPLFDLSHPVTEVQNKIESSNNDTWGQIEEAVSDFYTKFTHLDWFVSISIEGYLNIQQLSEYFEFLSQKYNPKTDIVFKSSYSKHGLLSPGAFFMSRAAAKKFIELKISYRESSSMTLTHVSYRLLNNLEGHKSPILSPEIDANDFTIKFYASRTVLSKCGVIDVVPMKDTIFLNLINNNVPAFQFQNILQYLFNSDLHWVYNTFPHAYCWDDKLPYMRTWKRIL